MNAPLPYPANPSDASINPGEVWPPPVPTSLDPEDSPVDRPPPQPQPNHAGDGHPCPHDHAGDAELCIDWRHTCWHRDRLRVFEALQKCPIGETRLQRFADCGIDAWVMEDCNCPGHLRVAASYCHDRWCVPCGRAKARIVADNLRSVIQDQPHRFITLTLKAKNEGLANRISMLYASFRRLRGYAVWRNNVVGGAAFCEPVWSTKSECWHVHLHIVAEGKFIPQAELSAAWLKATGDSYIVDVRLIYGHDKAVDYVCKYAAKPLDPATLRNPDLLSEAIMALHGRRLILPFGTWHGIRLSEVSYDTQWKALTPLGELLRRAAAGDEWAQSVLRNLRGAQSQCQLDLFREPP